MFPSLNERLLIHAHTLQLFCMSAKANYFRSTPSSAHVCSCRSSQLPSCFRRNHPCVLQSFLAVCTPWHNRTSPSPTSCFRYVWLHGEELVKSCFSWRYGYRSAGRPCTAAPPRKGCRFEKSKKKLLKPERRGAECYLERSKWCEKG